MARTTYHIHVNGGTVRTTSADAAEAAAREGLRVTARTEGTDGR